MAKYEPCPFCGGEAGLTRELRDGCRDGDPDAWAYYCICRSCAAQGPWMKSDGNAVRFWNRRALLPAASGWVEVTDDPGTWPDANLAGRVLAERGGVEQMPGDGVGDGVAFRHVYDEALDARRDCAPSARGLGRVIRWMPWPAASALAACGHGAILREALDFIQDVQRHRIGHAPHRVYADGLYDCDRVDALALRLRAAADAAGKEGK